MTGRIIDATTGGPIRQIQVTPPLLGPQEADPKGRFVLHELPAGEFLRHIRRFGQRFPEPVHRVKVKLLPGQDTDVGDLAVPP